MAGIDEAYNNILLDNLPLKVTDAGIVGVLLGRVVNTAYHIYEEADGKYFVEDKNQKKYVDISPYDHGKDVTVSLVGGTYRVMMFNAPYKFKA